MFPWNHQFPFNQHIKDLFEKGFPNEIESYVHGVLGKSMQQFTPGFPFQFESNHSTASSDAMNSNDNNPETRNNELKYHVFETHDDVYIHIPISDKSVVGNIKIYHTSNKSIIEGIPNEMDKHEIVLPAIVKKKGSQAIYKDDLLQIKIPKNTDLQFTEIDVQER